MDEKRLEEKVIEGKNIESPKRAFYTIVFTSDGYQWHATGILELTVREAFEKFQVYNYAKDFRIVEVLV